MGKPLYSHLGFTQIGDLIIQVAGEEDKLVVAAMVYVPPDSDDCQSDDMPGVERRRATDVRYS